MEQIQDGTGRGYVVKVDENNRLHTDTVSTPSEQNAATNGLSFNINTGIITLTNASTKNAVMYVKNNEDYDLVVVLMLLQTGASTGGSGNILVDVLRNPTTGTIVSGATSVEINQNKNFGSSRTLDATAYVGATGLTFTNGSKIFESILATTTQRIPIETGGIVIPKGSSIGINITTSAGNSSMACEFALSCYLEAED